ncbi:MAG: OmpA family protein, partial [Burkholderiales bacterium]
SDGMTKRPLSGKLAPAVAILAAIVMLAACAAPPPAKAPRTTVVLLPDEDGQVGAVTMETPAGSQSIDQAFSYATAEGATSRPSEAKAMGRDSVDAEFGNLLKAQPLTPKFFVLYFLLDKAVLTEQSQAMLPTVIEAARARKPTEITIFGHADATGKPEHNDKLSAERAKTVADLLKSADPALGVIEVQYFGHRAPQVQSGTRAQPKNRRAEVMIL